MTLYKPLAWLRSIGRPAPTLASLWDHLGHIYRQRAFLHLRQPLWGDPEQRTTLTFATMAEAVGRLAGVLRARGVQPGDRVAIAAANRAEYAVALFAIVRLGATAVPLHHQITDPEVEARCAQARVRWLVTDRAPVSAPGAEVISCEDAMKAAWQTAPAEPATVEARDLCAILFTSGTTGQPKGAQITCGALMSMRRLFTWAPNLTSEVGVYALPTAHMMALSTVLYAAFGGGTLWWRERFDAEDVLHVIENERPTFFVGVPAMYGMLLTAGAEERDLASIRYWVSSADAMPLEWLNRFVHLGCALPSPGGERLFGSGFAELFGMVELAGAAMARITLPPWMPPANAAARLASWRARSEESGVAHGPAQAAFPLPPYRLRVVNDAGEDVALGEVGELWLRGPGVTRGYDADEAASKAAITDGWLHTGDLVRRHRAGAVSFAGRKKEVIKHGGYSVFPAQVEAVLVQHPQVREAVVFGAAHPTKGEVPVAVVTLHPDAAISGEELVQWARTAMTSYMRPRAVGISSEPLPHNVNEKLQRQEAKQQWEQRLQAAFPLAFKS